MPEEESNVVLFTRVARLRRVPSLPSTSNCSCGIRLSTGNGTLGTIFKVENPGNGRMFRRESRNHVAFRLLLGSTTQHGYTDMRLKGVDFFTGERLANMNVFAHILIHLAFCKCLYLLQFYSVNNTLTSLCQFFIFRQLAYHLVLITMASFQGKCKWITLTGTVQTIIRVISVGLLIA
jgi:hypothetical protein